MAPLHPNAPMGQPAYARCQGYTGGEGAGDASPRIYGELDTLKDPVNQWNKDNPKHPWESNPFVWVVTFEVKR